MRALDHKLLRDLWGMKGQALAISMVVSSGVATFIMCISTLDSLRLTQAAFYKDQKFAQVFASLKRAPETLKARIEAIDGVQTVQTRVLASVHLEVEDYPHPVTGLIVSVPDHGAGSLNQLYIRRGRRVEADRDDEIVISESFADAHGFQLGDHFYATINGKRKRLRIVGVALSPEYVYQLEPGSIMPDFESYGLLWMARTPLSTAYGMEGAFNDVALTLSTGARSQDVIDRLDELLANYGGLGAIARKDQMSHRYLSEEFRGLELTATMFPVIFLAVAVFLLNVVVSRLLTLQREQVAILKAFGYSNSAVVVHYLKLVLLIVLFGLLVGVPLGIWLGKGMGNLYMEYYRFPFLRYELRPSLALTAALINAGAAVLGTVYVVARAASQPPAQGMQPAPPPRYRPSFVERLGLARLLDQPTRMIIRNIERRPVKALLTVTGIALACAILVLGGFFGDAVDHMVNIQFKLAQTDDVTVTFVEATSKKALYALHSLRGVEHVEPFRAVPARLRFEHRSYRTAIRGMPPNATLYRLLNKELQPVEPPPEGVLMTDYLASILGIRPGQMLTVEVLEGSRPVVQAPVLGLVNEWVGVSAYMRIESLNRLMREGPVISGAYLEVDPLYQQALYPVLDEMPRVLGTAARKKTLENFYETMANQMLMFAFIGTLLASTIAVGVVYNSARIALSERSRELASLRVLGFTRGEISYILLGELALLTLAALPVGFLIGKGLAAVMVAEFQMDLYRIPLVIDPVTYAFAATVVLSAFVLSGLLVKRKLDHLDLVAVLKTKE